MKKQKLLTTNNTSWVIQLLRVQWFTVQNVPSLGQSHTSSSKQAQQWHWQHLHSDPFLSVFPPLDISSGLHYAQWDATSVYVTNIKVSDLFQWYSWHVTQIPASLLLHLWLTFRLSWLWNWVLLHTLIAIPIHVELNTISVMWY